MKRTTLLVAVLVVVGMLVVPAAGALAQGTETDEDDGAAEIAPGERLGGVVGVQQSEFDGEIERNAFAIALDRADDNGTKAGLIAEKLGQTETRLSELEERKSELQQQRENETISEGQYRAQTAKLATETETAKQQLNRSNATAATLPEETLREHGVNTTAIRTLSDRANELSGGEVAEIARSIAGDRSGMVDRGPPGERGPGADRGAGESRTGDGTPGTDRSAGENRTDDGESGTQGNEDYSDEQRDGDGAATDDSERGEVDGSSADEDSDDSGSQSGTENGTGSNAGGSAGMSDNAGSR